MYARCGDATKALELSSINSSRGIAGLARAGTKKNCLRSVKSHLFGLAGLVVRGVFGMSRMFWAKGLQDFLLAQS